MDQQQQRGIRQRDVLPLAVRRALWERVWDRLLAPLPEECRAQEPKQQGTVPVRDGTREGW